MKSNALCQYLNWDSEFFGYRIARVNVNRLSQEDMARVLMWCTTYATDCLYLLVDADDEGTIRLAEQHKFHFVDIRMSFEMQLDEFSPVKEKAVGGVIRPSTLNDLPALRAIAKVSHRDSRFYNDRNFPRSHCDILYETWIDKSCHGYADMVLVAELDGQPIGYISCHLLDQAKGQIGLCGVSKESQGKGIGLLLVSTSLRWFVEHGVQRVTVVTQGRNCKAQRLYQRCGFLTQAVQLWFHKWFSLTEAKTTSLS